MKLRALLALVLTYFWQVQAQAFTPEWTTLGNGGAYQGVPPFQFDGPFTLNDPSFTCPKGSIGPRRPGYRELIRLDHFGPSGCEPGGCQLAMYARQSSCGGEIRFIEHRLWEKSEVYKITVNERTQRNAGFHVMVFDGQLYEKREYIPDPDELPPWNEAWCVMQRQHSFGPADDKFEVLIQLGQNARLPSPLVRKATVYFKDVYGPGPKFEFKLKALLNHSVERQTANGALRYTGDGFELTVASALASDPSGKRKGTLQLSVGDTAVSVPVACVVAEPGRVNEASAGQITNG